jgi:hypothetical protein
MVEFMSAISYFDIKQKIIKKKKKKNHLCPTGLNRMHLYIIIYQKYNILLFQDTTLNHFVYVVR